MNRYVLRSALLVCASFACAAPAVLAAGPLDRFVPKRIEADPNKEYTLTEDSGPWLIMATAFTGDGAKSQARKLVLELREKHKLPAYTYQKKFDFSEGERGRGVDRYGAPLKMRYQRGAAVVEIAVLVGDFPTVDDPEAQKTLKKIKYLVPVTLDPTKNKQTSQTLATLRRHAEESALRRQRGSKNGGRWAMRSSSPIRCCRRNILCPRGIDKLVIEMNKGVKNDLLDCKKKYTVKVATFTGQVVLDQQKIQEIEKGGKFKSRLDVAADNAHKVCEALRAKGVEAYEFHDRYASMVTVGSFDSVGQPRTDGKIEINPAMHAIITTYGVDAKSLSGQGNSQGEQAEDDPGREQSIDLVRPIANSGGSAAALDRRRLSAHHGQPVGGLVVGQGSRLTLLGADCTEPDWPRCSEIRTPAGGSLPY